MIIAWKCLRLCALIENTADMTYVHSSNQAGDKGGMFLSVLPRMQTMLANFWSVSYFLLRHQNSNQLNKQLSRRERLQSQVTICGLWLVAPAQSNVKPVLLVIQSVLTSKSTLALNRFHTCQLIFSPYMTTEKSHMVAVPPSNFLFSWTFCACFTAQHCSSDHSKASWIPSVLNSGFSILYLEKPHHAWSDPCGHCLCRPVFLKASCLFINPQHLAQLFLGKMLQIINQCTP